MIQMLLMKMQQLIEALRIRKNLDHDDTDPDGDDVSGSFTITAIRTGRESATSGTTVGTIGQALNGTYGVLTVSCRW